MKNIFFATIIAMSLVSVSCDQKTQKNEASAELYSCPMHPEVKGAKGETCPKCGMELTVPVSKTKTEKKHESHSMNTDTITK